MLKELFLENFVIAKSIKIPFDKGFNVISGETGAGKTLLLQALNLISGDRSDFSFIRSGFEIATLQALFDLPSSSPAYDILKSNNFNVAEEEYLIVRRMLYKQGKTKILINDQDCSLSLLKALSPFLFESVSQNMQVDLKQEKFQQDIVDEDLSIQETLKLFRKAYEKHKHSQFYLETLKKKQEQKPILLESLSKEIETIESVDFSEQAENTLFEQYKNMAQAQEKFDCLQNIFHSLSNYDQLINSLREHEKKLSKIADFDNTLIEIKKNLSSLSYQFNETLSNLESYLYDIDFSDDEYKELEDTLSKIKAIKRQFGPNPEDVQEHLDKILKEKNLLENIETLIEDESLLFYELENELKDLDNKLSTLRQIRAESLSYSVTKYLQELDMEKCHFKILCDKVKRGLNGSDKVSFALKANTKEPYLPIAKRASGGELSRILLSLKLATKNDKIGRAHV